MGQAEVNKSRELTKEEKIENKVDEIMEKRRLIKLGFEAMRRRVYRW